MSRFIALFLLAFASLTAPAFAIPDEPPSAANPQYLFALSYSDAEEAISRGLAEKGAGSKIAAVINGRQTTPLFSYKSPLAVEIRGLQFDRRSARWSANLLFIAGDQVISAIPAGGRFEEILEVPVLKREVRNGDVIRETDVEVHDFPMAHTRTDTVTDIANLIGKSPARSISPFRPIRTHEIASPSIVKKNGIVQMRYVSPGMEITATGQAMDEGAKGDVINVRNTTSRKIVRAVIENENTVNILGSGLQTGQLAGENHATN